MASTERENAGLEADIGISLGKLTRQLASAEARMLKTAKKFETDFANANRKVSAGFDRTSKSAQDSAGTIGREMDRLRAKYDPIFAASKRYEASLEELNRAHKVGALNAAQYERALEQLNAEYQRAAGASTAMNSGLAGVARGSGAMRSQIQNAAFQVGDFAVQVGAGTSAAQALGQQLPQLLGGFGVMGAVLGAVAAAGIPLVRFLMDSGVEAKSLEEKLTELEAAVSSYQSAVEAAIVPTAELREKYGQATTSAQEFLAALAEINKAEALNALAAAIEDITSNFGNLTSEGERQIARYGTNAERAAKRISDEFGIAQSQALLLVDAMRDLQNAEGVTAQADAARQLLDLMVQTIGPIEEMEGAALELAKQLAQAGVSASEFQGTIEQTNFTIDDMVAGLSAAAGNLSTMAGQAATLGQNMWNAANAAWDFARAQAEERKKAIMGGPDAVRDQVREDLTPSGLRRDDIVSRTVRPGRAPRPTSGGGSSSSSSGGGSVETPLFDIGQDALDKLQRQIEMIGKTSAEVAGLTVKYKLLDEAKKRNLDLDQMQAGTGKTLREEIDAQAQSVEKLAKRYEQAQEQAKFYDQINTQLKDGLVDAIVEGENFAGVLADVTKALAKAALQAALFNEGPFSSGSGGGLLSGLFSGFTNALAGKRAMGGPVSQGRPYLVGENGPEVMVPSTAGKIIPNGKFGGGGPVINYSPMIDARGADAAAVARLEVAMRRSEAEFSTRAVAAVRQANGRNVGGRL
jgi:ethanolamine utilization microcompartment shell protein EutL